MFCKKTYRPGRWIERLLVIGEAEIIDPESTEIGWLKIKPQYMVEVRSTLRDYTPGDLVWKPVSHIRLVRPDGIDTDYCQHGMYVSPILETTFLQCRLIFGGSVGINHQRNVRVTHSTAGTL